MGFNGFMNKIRTAAAIAVGIFTSSSNLADKAQIALNCRNYQGIFPVYNAPPKVGVKWVVLSIGTAVIIYIIGIHTVGMIDMSDLFFGKPEVKL